MEYSSDSSSYSDVVKRNTKEVHINKINFWDTYKSDGDEDNQSTNSLSFKSFSIALSNNKGVPIKEEKAENDIKKENKRLKRKARNLKKYILRNFRNKFISKHKTRSMKESTKNVPSPPTSLITTTIPRAPMNLQFKTQQMNKILQYKTNSSKILQKKMISLISP